MYNGFRARTVTLSQAFATSENARAKPKIARKRRKE